MPNLTYKPYKMATPSLTDNEVIEAVGLYYLKDWTQAHLAVKYNVTQPTISNCKREDERWGLARDALVEQLKDMGLPAAWRCLVNEAKGGDVSAAKEILNRIAGATEQRIRISEEVVAAEDEELIEILRDGNHPSGSKNGTETAGRDNSNEGQPVVD